MNKFLSILRGAGAVTAVVAPVAGAMLGNAATGVLINTVVTAVMAAEQPGFTGEAKKRAAMQNLMVASGGIVALIQTTTGRQLVDEVRFMSALSRITDGVVDLMDAFSLLPKAKAAE